MRLLEALLYISLCPILPTLGGLNLGDPNGVEVSDRLLFDFRV
jgi:hypothetical protein